MSCTSPLTVASTMRPLPPASAFSMCGSRKATAAFMVSADCSTNGSCICPEPNRSPTIFMPPSSGPLTTSRAAQPSARALVEVGLQPVAIAVDDALLEPALDRPVAAVLGDQAGRRDPFEEPEQLGQRVVAGGRVPAVVDQVEAHLDDAGVDLVQRHDPGRVDDGGVEPGLLALVEEDRVEGVAGGGGEAEADVGEPDEGAHAGELGLDPPDALDGLDPVPAALLHPGADRQHQGIEEQVLGRQPVAVDGQVVDGPGRPQLPLGRAGLALGVDAGADHRGAVLAGQRQEAVQAGARRVAVLEVDRVEDGLAGDQLQAGLDHGRLGRVEHDRQGGLGGEAAGHFLHVGHAVLAGVVDAHVEDVGAALDRLPGHGHAGVPVIGQHGLPELLGAVGVGALADDQERRGLVVGHVAVDGGHARLPVGPAGGGGQMPRRPRRRPAGAPGWCRSIRRPR